MGTSTKGNGAATSQMDSGGIILQTARCLKDNGKKDCGTVRAKRPGQTDPASGVLTLKIESTGTALLAGKMDQIIQGNSTRIIFMGREPTLGVMDRNMKASTEKGSSTD